MSQQVYLISELKYSFWYFASGEDINSFDLMINKQVIWSFNQSNKNQWLNINIQLPQGKYKVKI